MMPKPILEQYGLNKQNVVITAFGSGLINHTWLVTDQNKEYILQRINNQIFTRPEDIASNIDILGKYLSEHYPDYLFVKPVKTINGQDLVYLEAQGYFRLSPFVPNSHTIDVVTNPSQ
ncbi:MAG: aminoglycoside phosphotransferase family protein, partial [Flavisolibacter sp.]|nr:aminoglycoside phosphotransferase family protein [Flavisolibacter sp.]